MLIQYYKILSSLASTLVCILASAESWTGLLCVVTVAKVGVGSGRSQGGAKQYSAVFVGGVPAYLCLCPTAGITPSAASRWSTGTR